MDIQASKIELAKMVLDLEDSSVVERFIDFLKSETNLSEKQKRAIDVALLQLESGEGIPHHMIVEETKARYPKYFNR